MKGEWGGGNVADYDGKEWGAPATLTCGFFTISLAAITSLLSRSFLETREWALFSNSCNHIQKKGGGEGDREEEEEEEEEAKKKQNRKKEMKEKK